MFHWVSGGQEILSEDGVMIARIYRIRDGWQGYVNPKYHLDNINYKYSDSEYPTIEHVKWKFLLDIYNDCNAEISRYVGLRNNLPSYREQYDKAFVKTMRDN